MSGTLHGVGLGPGDPELMTLKAHRLIRSARVIAWPAPEHGESFARSIAAAVIPADAEEIAIRVPMVPDRAPAQAIYDAAAERIAAHLAAGTDVVALCEGDPLFYGSFMYLHARIAPRHRVVVVPGVSALAARLAEPGAVAIVKVGRHLARLRAALGRAGRAERAVFVAHASLPRQRVLPLAEAPEDAPYFSMILVPGEDPHA